MQTFQNLDEQFTDQQIAALDKPLDKRQVSTRKGASGRSLRYIEGHDAIDNANRIFGYGNWAYETLECLQTVINDPFTGEAVGVCYKAKVKLTVRGCVSHIIEVGSQPVAACSAAKVSPSVVMESHEQAEKGAVTDALKRALRTFGDQFGNGLYGDGRVIIEVAEQAAPISPCKVEPPVVAATVEPAPVALTQTDNDTPLQGEEVKVSATAAQKSAILSLCTRIKSDPPRNLRDLTMEEAKNWITILQKEQPKEPTGALNGARAFSLMR